MVMKFCGWIDLIKGECSAHEPLLLLYFIFELLPLVYFCLVHITRTIQAMGMKFCGYIDLIKEECSAH